MRQWLREKEREKEAEPIVGGQWGIGGTFLSFSILTFSIFYHFFLIIHLSPSAIPCSFALGLTCAIICSYSSDGKRLGTSPEFSILLMSSRNSSTTIWKWKCFHSECIVEVLTARYLCVCEKEDSVFIFDTCHDVQFLQVFVEWLIVVASTEFYLEALVPTHVWGKSCETLLASSSYSYQQGISSRLTYHPSYPGKYTHISHESQSLQLYTYLMYFTSMQI